MDLEDNETVMNSFDGQLEDLKGTVASLEAQLAHNQSQMSDMEARLEDSKAQVEKLCATAVIFIVILWSSIFLLFPLSSFY